MEATSSNEEFKILGLRIIIVFACATVIIAAIIGFVMLNGATSYNIGQAGSVTAEPKEVRLGRIPEDGFENFSIKLENRSNKTVPISNIGTSCGCTRASTDSTTITPHGFIVINGQLRAEMPPGHYVRVVYATLGHPHTKLNIPVDVDVYSPEYALNSRYFDFGNIKFGTSQTKIISIQGAKSRVELHPRVLQCPSWIEISWRKRSQNYWTGTVTAHCPSTDGKYDDEAQIDPGIGGGRPFYIHVSMTVKGLFHCSPPMIDFGETNHIKSASVKITSLNIAPANCFSVASLPPGVKTSFSRANKETILHVTVDSDHISRIISGNVVLKVNVKNCPQHTISIPIVAIMR